MKKILFIAAVAACMFTSCNQSAPKVDEKSQTAETGGSDLKIAYIEVDSIMSQYQFCKEYSLILQKKSQNIQNTINQKGQSLQAAAANFQQKIQQNAYTREQAEAINANLVKQQNDLQALQNRLGSEFQAETDKFNNALRDSIQHFLAKYNKDKKYALILSKAGDNILYADKGYDITNEVIAGLNKAYKPAAAKKEAAAAKKEEKKK
ncbi:MAG: OmpH family outer membrane protein [Prevotella sp.]|nr:OmpH family outer membrane protein [Prevotella sp.]